jgi:hypothetical protein
MDASQFPKKSVQSNCATQLIAILIACAGRAGVAERVGRSTAHCQLPAYTWGSSRWLFTDNRKAQAVTIYKRSTGPNTTGAFYQLSSLDQLLPLLSLY